jgi:hypothetical protein
VGGRKRFVAVDSLGLVWALLVTTADAPDRDAGWWLLQAVRGRLARVREVIADAGSTRRFVGRVRRACGWKVTTTRNAPEGFKIHPRRWVVEMVHSQMTKPDVFALRAGGEDVPDLDVVARHDDAIDQQLDQLPLPLEGGVPQPRRHPLAERRQRGGEAGRPAEACGLSGQPCLLLGQGRGPRLQLAAPAAVLRQRDDAPEVRLGQPLQLPGY